MSAAQHDIVIEQGATWTLGLLLKKNGGKHPIDLTGHSGKSQIRLTPENSNVIANIDVTIDPNPKTGKVILFLNAATTRAFTFNKAVYDLEITDANGVVKRVIQGKVTLSPEVTKS